ncbi:NUDIX hydrolase [Ferrimicrobium sp.]|uniref:NUDIX hydrolase n=1 Tax=Ferrimicrobium sp. TaxID=2926050 RepID=UPI002639BD35|nr:NUDIX hydrolase [Ferrimicrobium sp.]
MMVVLAAGGAIYRPTEAGGYEVLLVHRPRYDDWSWPKGKCEPGESLPECAIREVEEETGICTTVGPILCVISYPDQLQRTKRVTYYALDIVTIGEHEPDHEIDQLAWINIEEVDQRLSAASDTRVTEALRTLLGAPTEGSHPQPPR